LPSDFTFDGRWFTEGYDDLTEKPAPQEVGAPFPLAANIFCC
jgi:hypothetical protein